MRGTDAGAYAISRPGSAYAPVNSHQVPDPGSMRPVSGGGWMFVWMMVALKVPICALLYLVWWATRAPEEADSGAEDWKSPRVGPDHPRPRKPRPPRRG